MDENEKSERDTHFANAASLLSERLGALYLSKGLEVILGDPNGEVKQQEITLFTQFAYDLVFHAFRTTDYDLEGAHIIEKLIATIPDLTAWPNTSELAP